MCIQQISSNLFPCDKRPTSLVVTSSLIVAVASAVLVGLACYFNWGVPAIGSLAAACGTSAIVALAIILCKRKVPEEVSPSVSKFVPEPEGELNENEKLAEQLYVLAKNDTLENFQEAVKAVYPIVLYDASFNREKIRPFSGANYFSLFTLLISEEAKWDYLRAILVQIEPESIRVLGDSQYETLYKIKDESLLQLVMSKMHRHCRGNLLREALACWPTSETCVSLLIKQYGESIWINAICSNNKLPPVKQLEYLQIIANNAKTNLFQLSTVITFHRKGRPIYSFQGFALHAAVNAGNHDLVRLLSEKQAVNNRTRNDVTPLLLAIMKNDIDSVNILLEAEADPKKAMSTRKAKNYTKLKTKSQTITPLELAESLQLTEIVKRLDSIKDKS